MGSHSKTSSIRKYDGDGNLTEKKCSKCKTFRSIDNYHKTKYNKVDGLDSWCKVCSKESYYRKRRWSGKESNEETYIRNRRFDEDGNLTEKKCGKCNKLVDIDYFSLNNSNTDGLSNMCKGCHKIYVKPIVKMENHSKTILKSRRYDEGGNLTEKKCSECNRWLSKPKSMYSKGKYTYDGLVSKCKSCLSQKKYSSLIRKYDGDGNLTEKQCSKCKTFRSIDNYHKGGNVIDGLSGWCKVCVKESGYEKRRLSGIESFEEVYLRKRRFDEDGKLYEKQCSKCEVWRGVDYFTSYSLSKDGLQSSCVVCGKVERVIKNESDIKIHTVISKIKITLPNEKYKSRERFLKRRKLDDEGYLVEKQCSKCKIFLGVDNYFKDKSNQLDGLYNNCKKCHRIKNKIQYEKKIDDGVKWLRNKK